MVCYRFSLDFEFFSLSFELLSFKPASWLTRAALSQGVSLGLLLKHLDLHPRADLDLVLTEKIGGKNCDRLPAGLEQFPVCGPNSSKPQED
jgi:hypothetical protein